MKKKKVGDVIVGETLIHWVRDDIRGLPYGEKVTSCGALVRGAELSYAEGLGLSSRRMCSRCSFPDNISTPTPKAKPKAKAKPTVDPADLLPMNPAAVPVDGSSG